MTTTAPGSLGQDVHTVIATPTFKGEAVRLGDDGRPAEPFTAQLIESLRGREDVVWLLGINGMPDHELTRVCDDTRRVFAGVLRVDPVACTGKGIIPALHNLNDRVVQRYPNARAYLRRDGREHPANISELEGMLKHYDHVGVSLSYSHKPEYLGEADWQGDRDLRERTKNRLGHSFSHAHGMQIVSNTHFPENYRIMRAFEEWLQREKGMTLEWGYDLLLRAVSIRRGLKFAEMEYPAEVKRDPRSPEKVQKQIDNWSTVLEYFDEFWNTVKKEPQWE